MKLLFDQNLSPTLIVQLIDIYPGSTHVSLVSPDKSPDSELCSYAAVNDYLIVTKDSDFSDLSTLYGYPPKFVWISIGNCTTEKVATLLREHYEEIKNFQDNNEFGVLSLI